MARYSVIVRVCDTQIAELVLEATNSAEARMAAQRVHIHLSVCEVQPGYNTEVSPTFILYGVDPYAKP